MTIESIIQKTISDSIKKELEDFRNASLPLQRQIMDEFISMEQVLEMTQMTRQGIFKRIREGRLKAFKPGRALVFKREDVEAFILSSEQRKIKGQIAKRA
ncbi:MAG TPA: helix-turn-helix domain-containing protein [Flavobacteriales bacterium]|nr:helix-turn-helix domain-containing protein [Flavobacteriales bacterium]